MTTTPTNTITWVSADSTEGVVTARPHTLSEETKTITHPITGAPVTLHRLVALVDYPAELGFGPIKAGDKGGWVQSLDNLSWDSWVADDACLFDDARIENAVLLAGQSLTYGQAKLAWGVSVTDSAQVYGSTYIGCPAHIAGTSQVRGNLHLSPAYLGVANGTILEGTFTQAQQEQADLDVSDGELVFSDGQVHGDLLAELAN